MYAGGMRHWISLQSPSETRDVYGGVTVSWTTQLKTWAEIDPPKGREYFAAGQKQAEITTRVRIRYCSCADNDWRVKFGTRYFDINSIIDSDERHVEQILMCTESVA